MNVINWLRPKLPDGCTMELKRLPSRRRLHPKAWDAHVHDGGIRYYAVVMRPTAIWAARAAARQANAYLRRRDALATQRSLERAMRAVAR